MFRSRLKQCGIAIVISWFVISCGGSGGDDNSNTTTPVNPTGQASTVPTRISTPELNRQQCVSVSMENQYDAFWEVAATNYCDYPVYAWYQYGANTTVQGYNGECESSSTYDPLAFDSPSFFDPNRDNVEKDCSVAKNSSENIPIAMEPNVVWGLDNLVYSGRSIFDTVEIYSCTVEDYENYQCFPIRRASDGTYTDNHPANSSPFNPLNPSNPDTPNSTGQNNTGGTGSVPGQNSTGGNSTGIVFGANRKNCLYQQSEFLPEFNFEEQGVAFHAVSFTNECNFEIATWYQFASDVDGPEICTSSSVISPMRYDSPGVSTICTFGFMRPGEISVKLYVGLSASQSIITAVETYECSREDFENEVCSPI